jgi:hypothetical protein
MWTTKLKQQRMIEVKHNTDMFHVKITFEDTFSFAKVVKNITVSGLTLKRIQSHIGDVVIDRFDKNKGIHETLKLLSIERS